MNSLNLFLFISLFTFFSFKSFCQEKQSNEPGSDILADAPWRMKKTNSSGILNGIPIHIFVKDADDVGNNAELIYINIYIKNANETTFGNHITFSTYNNTDFLSLFSSKSEYDAEIDIQSFDASLPIKDPNFSIGFSSDTCVWPDNCTYVDITHKIWYFTITIPPEKLIGFNDIIDIKVDFSLNWQADVQSYLRVFRYNEDFPKLTDWYRGDAHYHSIYTNNSAEYGLPLAATKVAAKSIGIDWITLNDHSCDYDNYGSSIQNNWNRRTAEIQSINTSDTSMIYIGATEVSVNNSADNIIHLLCYPSENSPYSLSFLGDGDGDISPTSLEINDVLFQLSEVNGFAFAAHPFSSGDELSSLVDGGIWNVGDNDYSANGSIVNGFDEVICNDLSSSSDFYSLNQTQMLFKNTIKGGEIWNTRNSLSTTDEMMDPWNVNYDSEITPFAPYNLQNNMYHFNRFLSNFDATRFLWQKGLIEKNLNHNINNYRFYITAGSDAHGNFNYSNTDFVMGVVADIHDNAIGKPATLAYCPNGMGNNGSNVLAALKNGNVIISDGPIVSIGISTDELDNTIEYIPGDEVIVDSIEYHKSNLIVDLITTPEYGAFSDIKIIVGTINGEHSFQLSFNPILQNDRLIYNLDSIIEQIVTNDSILENEYFYLRAELTTYINYSLQSALYCKPEETFHCYTNPIWIKKPLTALTLLNTQIQKSDLKIFPNPTSDLLFFELPSQLSNAISVKIYDVFGKILTEQFISTKKDNELIKLSMQSLPKGIYYVSIKANNYINGSKFIKN